MTLLRLSLLSVFLLAAVAPELGQQVPQYRNSALPIEARVKDLLQRMTLEEKVAQLESTWQNHGQDQPAENFFVDDKGQIDEEKARRVFMNGLGQMTRPSENHGPAEMAEFTNRLQRIAIESSRFGIPVMFHEECLHG